jgi:hypothetical protein
MSNGKEEIRCPYCGYAIFFRTVIYPVRQIFSPNVRTERREKTDDYEYPNGPEAWICDKCENPMPDAIGKKLTWKWDNDEWLR